MKVSVEQFLQDAGITEPFYPGKRLVKKCRQAGEFKSHSVIFDWRNPDKIRIEVKAGLSGRNMDTKDLKNYPVSLQTPTFVDIEIINDNDTEDEGEGETTKGKAGGGSKGQKKGKKAELGGMMANAFAKIAEGQIPDGAEIVQMVVMGTEIAAEAFEGVFNKLLQQVNHAKVATTELLAQAGKFITKYTPPNFMEPKGNEDAVYKYDAEKNADIGYGAPAVG